MDDRLSTLRALLPEGVHEQLVSGGEDGLTDRTLRRWLVARKMDPKTAAADLAAHAAWRAAWAPKGRVLEEEVAADIKQNKVFLQGPDKHGRGVGILQACQHTMTDNTSQQRFITYVIDGIIASCDQQRNPDGKIVAIFDLRGLRLRNLDAVGLKHVFGLLQQHYVEVLAQLIMVGAPSLFWGVWRIVSPFIDPATRAKVKFVEAADSSFLMQELGPEVLPPLFGGTAAPVPAHTAWQQLLQRQRDQRGPLLLLTEAANGDCHQSRAVDKKLDAHDMDGAREWGPTGYQAGDAAVLIHAP